MIYAIFHVNQISSCFPFFFAGAGIRYWNFTSAVAVGSSRICILLCYDDDLCGNNCKEEWLHSLVSYI